MLEDGSTYGSMRSTIEEKKKFAMNSLKFNFQNEHFRKLFPEFLKCKLPTPKSNNKIELTKPTKTSITSIIIQSCIVLILSIIIIYIAK